MKHRCHNPNYSGYPKYGAKGITVCDRWRNSFADFYADMGPRPSPQHSIERIDNSRGYSPENCRWATLTEQANNKRRTIRIRGKTISEIAEETGVERQTIYARHRYGLSADKILSPEPLLSGKGHSAKSTFLRDRASK